MRPALVLGGILGLLAWASGAPAQTPAAPQRVQQHLTQDVEVRSGPSLSFYATARLRKGDPVVVVGADSTDPRWLKIEPPTGSFSWIDQRSVELKGQYAIVKDNDASVLVGSGVVDQKPSREAARLKTGTALVVLGEPLKDGTTSYLPIQPPPQEVRYIPADAVKGSDQVVLPAPGAPGSGTAASVSGAKAVIQQADQAYRAHDNAQARQLYETAAQQSQDYTEKAYCYNQLAQLQTAGPQWSRAQPTANTTALSPGAPPTATLGTSATGWQWSAWGNLRKTTIQKEGRPVYALEDKRGQILLYAVAPANMTLDPHLGKMMTMYGEVAYWSDQYVRTNYMTVSQVALLPPR